MKKIITKLKDGHNAFHVLFTLGFLFSFALAVPTFINSSFLETFGSAKSVGLLYASGSIITIFALVWMPVVLNRFGSFLTTSILITFASALLTTLAFAQTALIVYTSFILYTAVLAIIYFNFDLFIEHYSTDKNTGSIRGKFLTALNLAFLIGPMTAGILLTNGDYWKIYLLSAVVMFLSLVIILIHFSDYKDSKYERAPFWSTAREIWKNKNLFSIFMSNFLLRFFFAWMVIYTPIYLHEFVGFDWSSIGIIFTVMLLPFVLFELPAGRLADTKVGEKEILILGFIIMAFSTILLYFITEPVVWMWALALFLTRTGASLVEIMTESYFFKHIDGGDAHILVFFRNNRPIAYTIAPLAGSILLAFMDFKLLFVVLGVLMLVGIRYALALQDTK